MLISEIRIVASLIFVFLFGVENLKELFLIYMKHGNITIFRAINKFDFIIKHIQIYLLRKLSSSNNVPVIT